MVNRRRVVFICLLFFFTSILTLDALAADEVNEDVFSPSGLVKLDNFPDPEKTEAIIQFEGKIKDQDLAALSALDFDVLYEYHVIPAVLARGTVDSIRSLSHYSRLDRIDFNSDIEIDMEMSLSVINATRAWNREIMGSSKYPYIDGTGVTAVVVDTGIDAGHPDLDYGEKTIMNLFLSTENGYSWVEMENTDFSAGHGTHVAGTVAGGGDASAGARRGVAPGANLIGLTLVDPTVADYLVSLEWVYDHSRPNANPHNIRLATNSWHVEDDEHGVYDPDAPLTQVIEKLAFENNVVSTWSAGNHGRDDPEGKQGLTSPQGNTPVAIMCAAYERDGSAVADFSSKGMLGQNQTYPDVGAPGRDIWSAHARRTGISAGSKASGNPNPYYLAISGTSMSTPHVAGLVALLWQAAPSLKISDRHGDYSGDDKGWWENPNTRIHEIEWILEATATYLPPSPETGVPKEDNSTGMDGRPMDYCQGYGIIDAERAVAVALTLERLRKMHPYEDITVEDALRSYEDMMVENTETEKTDILKTQWEGEYSRYNDQFGRNLFEVNLTKYVFIPEGVKRVIIDLAYDPLDTPEKAVCDLTYTIDYDDDGDVDVTGGLEPVLAGNRHEEIEVGESHWNTLWAFGIAGQGIKLENPIRENSYVELRIEYAMSVQLILAGGSEKPRFVDFDLDNSMTAPLRFGTPSLEYDGTAIEMTVNYYDLDAVKLKEPTKSPNEKKEGFPWLLLALPIVAIALLMIFYVRKKRNSGK